LENGSSAEEKNNDGEGMLLMAARAGYLSVIQNELKKGISINTTNRHGCSALILATREGHLDVVKFLVLYSENFVRNTPELENAESLEHFWEQTNRNNQNALCIATKEGHEDLVAFFLSQNKFDVHLTFKKGYNVLDMAASKGYLTILRLLLSTGLFDDKNIVKALEVDPKKNKNIYFCLKYWLEWPCLRLLWIGNGDQGSTLSRIPKEVISIISNWWKVTKEVILSNDEIELDPVI